MRTLPPLIISEPFKRGLRRFKYSPRNSQDFYECHNLAPEEGGAQLHEIVLSLTDDSQGWAGAGIQELPTRLRTVVIHVQDFADGVTDLETVTVYLDGVSKGTTNASGELTIADVEVGGHSVKLTKASYVDSDEDEIANDFIMVT
jgi:hypothetical protein